MYSFTVIWLRGRETRTGERGEGREGTVASFAVAENWGSGGGDDDEGEGEDEDEDEAEDEDGASGS